MITRMFECFHIIFFDKNFIKFLNLLNLLNKEKFFDEKNIYPTLNQISNSGFSLKLVIIFFFYFKIPKLDSN